MSSRGTGYVIDPAIVNYERLAEEVFQPTEGDYYTVLTKTPNGGTTIDLEGIYEVFAEPAEGLAVAAALNNGLDPIDENAYGVEVRYVDP